MTAVTSNTRDCFRTFVGQRLIGLLFGAFPLNRHDLANGSTTMVFEDGRGLTLAANGSHWVESASDVQRAIVVRQNELNATKHDIAEVLALAGVVPQEP